MNEESIHNALVTIRLTEELFHNIFKQYYQALCAFSFRYLADADVANDIVQDAFVKLWQIRKDFLYIHQVKAFLYTTVHNKAINELEHSLIVNEYSKKILAKNKDDFFHDTVIEKETYRILLEAIDKLPTQCRAIMRLALLEKTNSEIANLLQISPETVHTQKRLAYKKLRKYLRNYYYLIQILLI